MLIVERVPCEESEAYKRPQENRDNNVARRILASRRFGVRIKDEQRGIERSIAIQ
jgi:hypothetical protein